MVSDLISESDNFKNTVKDLKKESRSVRNRLFSVRFDARWVVDVVEPLYNRPLVPNMRCGLWYVPPDNATGSCYFKSTDGHNTQWSFSIKRLNLHLIPLIKQNNGVVIVDSTRRGKKMSDALAKTIPIWCCVINNVVFGSGLLFLPPQTVSKIEYQQILERIPGFVTTLKELHILDNINLDKPLRPLWVYPGGEPVEFLPVCEEFHPVICCTASMQYQDGELHLPGFDYVQGAADDHELWAPQDFDHNLFWSHQDQLFEDQSDDTLNELIVELVSLRKSHENRDQVQEIVKFQGTNLSNGIITAKIDSLPALFTKYLKIVIFTETYQTSYLENSQDIIFFPFSSNKKYYKRFRDILPLLIDQLACIDGEVLILCENGQDLSIAVLLCLICRRYDLEWNRSDSHMITKTFIKLQLINITNTRQCNPHRNILNSCNSILM